MARNNKKQAALKNKWTYTIGGQDEIYHLYPSEVAVTVMKKEANVKELAK